MNPKALQSWLTLFLVIGILAGCGEERTVLHKIVLGPSQHEKAKAIHDDLIKYVNFIQGAAKDGEQAMTDLYNALDGKHDVAASSEIVDKKVVPVYEQFYEKVKNYNPATDVVKQAHQKYIDGANKIYRGLLVIRTMLQQNDSSMQNQANNLLNVGAKDIKDAQNMIIEFGKKYNVPLTITSDDDF